MSATIEQKDVRQQLADKIVEALERGVMPWRKGWNDRAPGIPAGLPRNAVSGNEYTGGNRLSLLIEGMTRGYSDPRWLTFNQARQLEGAIRKGEKGVYLERWDKIEFWKRKDVQILHNGRPVSVVSAAPHAVELRGGQTVSPQSLQIKKGDIEMPWSRGYELDLRYSKGFVVFNVQQCDGLKIEPIAAQKRSEVEMDERLKNIVDGMKRTGLKVDHLNQGRAFYSPLEDRIVLPLPEQFHSRADYNGTLLHECAHSTGHPSRLRRDLSGDFGSEKYAREELVAEFASAFLAAETGIERNDEQHAAYIASWIKAIKSQDGKDVLFAAARDAGAAVDCILDQEIAMKVARERESGVERVKSKPADLELG